ncbi:MAG: hypothetical protein HY791_06195 [Deltaproteobacteria bacterium]|nr:hypothetical protein [Deltaproteobacteria bacterium]
MSRLPLHTVGVEVGVGVGVAALGRPSQSHVVALRLPELIVRDTVTLDAFARSLLPFGDSVWAVLPWEGRLVRLVPR